MLVLASEAPGEMLGEDTPGGGPGQRVGRGADSRGRWGGTEGS